jgi:hypothetical protein
MRRKYNTQLKHPRKVMKIFKNCIFKQKKMRKKYYFKIKVHFWLPKNNTFQKM